MADDLKPRENFSIEDGKQTDRNNWDMSDDDLWRKLINEIYRKKD